jgi:hypothetical protein
MDLHQNLDRLIRKKYQRQNLRPFRNNALDQSSKTEVKKCPANSCSIYNGAVELQHHSHFELLKQNNRYNNTANGRLARGLW